ncbi:hypothetical protein ACHAXN_012045 [Cyclotella atomus]
MNNIISAKERKRQIRERRRSLQNQSSAAANGAAIDGDTSSERLSKAQKLENNSGDNWDQTNGSYSRASTAYLSCEGTRDATVQFESKPNEDFVDATSSRSLFSAVMSRSSATPDEKPEGTCNGNGMTLLGNVMQSTNSSTVNDNSYNTEKGRQINNVTFSASTPIKSPSRRAVFDRANSPGRSPGGYGIMQALDGVSDFTQTFYNMKDEGDQEEDKGDQEEDEKQSQEEYHVAKIVTRVVPLHLTNEHTMQQDNANSFDAIIEETKMANSASMNTTFYQEPVGISLMDWSLKKRVRILSSSPGSLPETVTSSFSRDRKKWPPSDDGLVQQLAIHNIANTSFRSNLFEESYGKQPSLEEMALAKWLAATMYYQHPAVHPLPASVLLENNNSDKKSDKINTPSLSVFNNQTTYQRVRLQGIGSMGGLGTSDKLQKSTLEMNAAKSIQSDLVASFPRLLDKRICEWQDAFRSMYSCWRSKMLMIERRYSTGDRYKRPSADEVSRCCFYSIAPGQIILFRVSLTTDDKLLPIISFSSTTAKLRAKIKSMGAKLKVLRPNRASDESRKAEQEFTEDMVENLQPQSLRESQGEAADLRALREANYSSKDNRPTEVEVTQKKKAQGGGHASSVPPLYVSGEDECAIVFELLLNTCGLTVSGHFGCWQFLQNDVPLLLCRSIGPCLNTVPKSLSISARRDNVYWNQLNGQEGQNESNSESVMEIYGPILPCSLRDMMCATINWVTLDEKLDEYSAFDAPTQPMNSKGNGSDSKAESRQVSMFLQAHEGEYPVALPMSTGTASSYSFNGSILPISNESNDGWSECSAGEGLNSLVWNAARATELSYNTFYST